MKTKIILVRHAESEGNVQGRLSGQTDFDLTEKGFLQVEKLADRLEDENINVIYSSHLKRAYLTAKGIAKKSSINHINVSRDIVEIYFGKCDGLTWNEIDEKYPNVRRDWKEIHSYPINIPDQEDFLNLQKRFYLGIKKIAEDNPGKNICIVSHGTAIGSFMGLVHNIDIGKLNTLTCFDNASFAILEYENDKFIVLSEADSSYLLKGEKEGE